MRDAPGVHEQQIGQDSRGIDEGAIGLVSPQGDGKRREHQKCQNMKGVNPREAIAQEVQISGDVVEAVSIVMKNDEA